MLLPLKERISYLIMPQELSPTFSCKETIHRIQQRLSVKGILNLIILKIARMMIARRMPNMKIRIIYTTMTARKHAYVFIYYYKQNSIRNTRAMLPLVPQNSTYLEDFADVPDNRYYKYQFMEIMH